MSSVESGELAAERATVAGFPRGTVARYAALGIYFTIFGFWTAKYGIPVQRELVVLWVLGALACASIGRPPWQTVQLVLDWLPLVVVLAAYDFSRGAADSLGIGVHVHPMLDFDRFVFLGQTPTEWLQAHLDTYGAVRPWDVAFTLTYTSYFVVPFVVGGVLWARDRLEFLRYSKRLVTLSLAALATYIAFPAAPPWMAADMGLLDGVRRTTSKGWEVIGTHTAGLFSEGQAGVNLVAAVPSLHAGMTALVAAFLYRRSHTRWALLLFLYPLAMAVTLIATGEHYFFDILLGWIYTAIVMAGWTWWERRRRASAEP